MISTSRAFSGTRCCVLVPAAMDQEAVSKEWRGKVGGKSEGRLKGNLRKLETVALLTYTISAFVEKKFVPLVG